MHRIHALFTILLLLINTTLYAQKITGRVMDGQTKEPIPFATIKFGDGGQGTVGELSGQFEIPSEITAHISWIEVTSLGYKARKINLPLTQADIYLQPLGNTLNEIVVTPPYEKMRRIINNAIANKNKNNPDKYDWYQCHVYYKMLIDLAFPDSIMNDTSARNRKRQNLVNTQHLAMSETYSIRTWKQPQKLQEEVLASRISGLKKSMFTSLVTDVLPFHAYSDYLTLNGKDYHNPVSRGYEQYYQFNLADELMCGADTVWILSFRPKGHNANDLKGTVYINSSGYAISQIIARASDTMLKMNVRIEQQYEQVPYAGGSRWFPKHLNYIIDWHQQSKTQDMTFCLKGNSRIDSVDWQEDKNFKFDKAHTVKLQPKADELSDTTWKSVRPVPLDAKEVKTYRVIDSIGQQIHLDDYVYYTSKLPEGKVPIGILDLDLKRLFSYNYYENVRLGLGLQTNEKLIKWLALGGWAGYGFGDTHWKYGAFAETYADEHKEFVIKAGYTDDINDPGRVHLNKDLDKSYLRSYLLRRVDETKTYQASVKKKLGYWNWEFAAIHQEIIPQYQYALRYESNNLTDFTAKEVSLSFRYAFAERTAPSFNYYYSLGSKYPIWYGKLISGTLESGGLNTPYTQALTAVLWHKHINRLGYEHFLIEGGKSWSDETLPLSKLFAGNGFKYDSKGLQEALYTFGGMMTIYPYEYYTDQFVNFIFRHDFDWKLYRVEIPKTKLSSAPNICLQYNMLYGTLAHPEAQQYVAFSVPDNAYHEAGLLLNNLLRIRYANLYYLTLNVGYFYHLAAGDVSQNGRVVFGAGVEF